MALTQQKPLALASVGKVEATRASLCMSYEETAGAVHVNNSGAQKHWPGPSALEGWILD